MRHLSLWNDNPWRSLSDLQRIFDQGASRTEDIYFQPSVDVEEDENKFLLSFDLPGVSKKDINIEVHENQLYVTGERKSESKTRSHSERVYGKFQRVLTLPTNVNTDRIEAKYEDGVLTLEVPKAENAKPRQIKIGESSSKPTKEIHAV